MKPQKKSVERFLLLDSKTLSAPSMTSNTITKCTSTIGRYVIPSSKTQSRRRWPIASPLAKRSVLLSDGFAPLIVFCGFTREIGIPCGLRDPRGLEIVNRFANSFVKIDLGLPTQQRAGASDIWPAHLWIVDG